MTKYKRANQWPETLRSMKAMHTKKRAFNAVVLRAKLCLELGTPHAFELIWGHYQKYEQVLEDGRKQFPKGPSEYPPGFAAYNDLTINDVYARLSQTEQAKWDSVPELRGWRETCN